MSKSTPVAASPEPLLAASLALPEGAGESMTALQAMQRIKAWHATIRQLMAVAEAQVMEALWVIRREHPGQARFAEFLASQDSPVAPDKAWLMAQTWDAARRNRGLRELTRAAPDQALELVREFIEAGNAEQLHDLDEDDAQVAALLSAPPRARRTRLRELIKAGQAAREGRNPDDIARIERLEAEREARQAAAGADGVTDLDAHPRTRLRKAIAELREAESRIAHLADDLESLLTTASANARAQVLATTDVAIGALERISGAALPPEDRA